MRDSYSLQLRFVVPSVFRRPAAFPLMLALLAMLSPGCGVQAPPPAPATAEPAVAVETSPAEQVLQRMIAAYQGAQSYHDQAVVRLKYRQQGQWFEDEGELSVSLVRPNKLQLRAYQLTLVSDGSRLYAVIADPGSDDLDGQVVVRTAPPRFQLDTIYEDRIMMDVMSGGMGGPPVTLELLLSDTPLRELLASSRGIASAGEGTIRDRICDRVQVKLEEGQLVFWVDRESSLLLRLEYPADHLAREMAAGNCSDVSLTAEFLEARIADPLADDEFVFAVPETAKRVTRFVLPPQPLPSEVLGQLPDEFFFTGLKDERITRDSLLGKVAILLWFNDHPASQTAVSELERIRQTLASDPTLAFYAVCTEPSSVSHAQVQALVRRWGSDVPLVRDLQAFGRDVFRVPFAPTLVVMNARGIVQIFEVGANPNLAAELPDRLRLLAAGEDLAAVQLAQFRQRQLLYQQNLTERSRLVPQDARTPRDRMR